MKYHKHYEKQKIPVGSKAEGDAMIAETFRDRPRSNIAVYVENGRAKKTPGQRQR